ncbi:hypothetical protein [Actinoplanes sp. NPDC051411]|uniref:hypothetical protein n=1 Tax=Actinoplanes sp. NPDC051411 TaxID=3155522 RepID=UPI003417E30D
MTIVLGLIFAAGAAAVVVCVFAWNPGWAEADGPTEGWNVPVYRLGQWAEENQPHHHSEPTLAEITSCLYCGSAGHTTFLHASR